MVDENIQNQRLTCFLGQQALENALKPESTEGEGIRVC